MKPKKLSLHRETLLRLDEVHAAAVQGGAPTQGPAAPLIVKGKRILVAACGVAASLGCGSGPSAPTAASCVHTCGCHSGPVDPV